MINSIEELQKLVVSGVEDFSSYGDVRTVIKDNLILFNYTEHCQYEGRWNYLERISRGLILDRLTGEVVARPFDKFFNYGEHVDEVTGVVSTDVMLTEATEKIDGSLGILYRHNDKFKIATRGSFDSDQAVWATNFFHTHHAWGQNIPTSYTLLFEIIYPGNRVVVDYGKREDLVLIGIRDRFTGFQFGMKDIAEWAARHGFSTPRIYDFSSYEDVVETAKKLTANEEGFVVVSIDGERFKIKGDAYKLAHKLMTSVTFKGVLEAVASGEFERMIEGVPDEFLGTVKAYKSEIDVMVASTSANVDHYLYLAPRTDRKTFALWVRENCPAYAQYMFAALDGKDILPLIYKNAFRNRTESI